MIFLGDLACPQEKINEFVSCVNGIRIFDDEIVVVNFEANIVDVDSDRNGTSLYNVSGVVKAFSQAKKVIFSLANNHMYDYPEKIAQTAEILKKSDIGTFGLMHEGHIEPYEYVDENGKCYAFFGHCWRLYTRTNPNNVNDIRVVDVSYGDFISCIKKYADSHKGALIYCFMHWNYDLEVAPFPMHREIARRLIDAGASGVIGSHPHVVQGYESYNNCPIAYSLGNFYLPSGIYFNGTLKYPEESKITLGISINDSDVEKIWFKTDSDDAPITPIPHEATLQCNEKVSIISKYDVDDYKHYFKSVRKKRFLVPVFVHPLGFQYRIQEAWAIMRVKLIKKLKG